MREVSDKTSLTEKEREAIHNYLRSLSEEDLQIFDSALGRNIHNGEWCKTHGLNYLKLPLGQIVLAKYHTAREVLGYNTVH